jgi:hypothetical protein
VDDRQFRYISKSRNRKGKLIRARLYLLCEFSHRGDKKIWKFSVFCVNSKNNEDYHHASNRETAGKFPRTTVRASAWRGPQQIVRTF